MIVALDLSLCATGYSKSDGTSGVLTPPKGWTGMARVQWILDRIDTLTQDATLTVIEGYAFGAKGRAVFDIAELGGVVRFHLFDHERPYVNIAPASLKMFATGKGNANKLEVFAAAVRKLGLAQDNDNIADARWLLEMALAHYDKRALTAKQMDAIDKVEWPGLSA